MHGHFHCILLTDTNKTITVGHLLGHCVLIRFVWCKVIFRLTEQQAVILPEVNHDDRFWRDGEFEHGLDDGQC